MSGTRLPALDRPGFGNPVLDAQACFRAVLSAFSRPGSVHEVSGPDAPPLDPATAGVLLTLVDADTTLWLDAALTPAWAWFAFHAGAPRAARAEDATFVCARNMPDLELLAAGTDAEPEKAATLVLQLPALNGGPRLVLTGPGLEVAGVLEARGLPDDFPSRWAANRTLFPRGVDLVLCAGRRLCALPRGTRVEAG